MDFHHCGYNIIFCSVVVVTTADLFVVSLACKVVVVVAFVSHWIIIASFFLSLNGACQLIEVGPRRELFQLLVYVTDHCSVVVVVVLCWRFLSFSFVRSLAHIEQSSVHSSSGGGGGK